MEVQLVQQEPAKLGSVCWPSLLGFNQWLLASLLISVFWQWCRDTMSGGVAASTQLVWSKLIYFFLCSPLAEHRKVYPALYYQFFYLNRCVYNFRLVFFLFWQLLPSFLSFSYPNFLSSRSYGKSLLSWVPDKNNLTNSWTPTHSITNLKEMLLLLVGF